MRYRVWMETEREGDGHVVEAYDAEAAAEQYAPEYFRGRIIEDTAYPAMVRMLGPTERPVERVTIYVDCEPVFSAALDDD